MGKLYSLISALLLAIGVTHAAVPDSYEWWFDNDISAVQVGSITDGKVDLQIDTSELPKGIHYFNMRLSASGIGAGAPYRRLFHSFGEDDGAISYLYWFDDDFASAQAGALSDNIANLDIDTSGLPKGLHYFNIRFSTDEGIFSAPYRKLFHALGDDEEAISYEYWYDEDFGSRIKGDMPVGSRVLTLDIATLPQGVHYFNCRVGYGDGTWGTVYRKMVLNLTGNVNATAYEYWVDDNYEGRVSGDFLNGENSYDVDLSGVRKGLHRFNYRLRTGEGTWGAPFTSYFFSSSNESHFTRYEYWLDNDFVNRRTAMASGNPVNFEVDLSAFDKSGGVHYFNLRACDDDGEWGPIYRKLLIFKNDEPPIIGYRHFLNGDDLGYVEVERKFVDSYMFDLNLPDSIRPSVRTRKPSFAGDTVSIAGPDSIDYTMQIRTELGWAAPEKWRLDISNNFSTKAIAMEVNSSHRFAVPKDLEFAAMKFTASGDSLYFRTDIAVALDIYRDGERVAALTPEQTIGMSMLKLEEGEYFGVMYGVADSEAETFTLHLMDTPNCVPIPQISYEEEMISISCSRTDAEIRYTIDGTDPDEESVLYIEPFPMKRNGTVKAKAWVTGSDIEPSAIAEYIIDTYKVAAPVAEFDIAKRELTLTTETKDASILYTHEYNPTDSIGVVWSDYVEPIRIRKNGTVYSRAVLKGYNDSEITVTEITALPDSVPVPEISFKDGIVEISCANGEAEIRYTLDGTEPTAESTLYEAPFALGRNGTVKAYAYIPGLDIEPSDIVTYVVDSYKVNAPTGNFDLKNRLLTLSCDTEGAKIYYTFSADEDWLEYTEPIAITRNCVVYAKGMLDGYNDSETALIAVTELADNVAPPVIGFADGTVTISCANSEAEIRYTLNGTDPTAESQLYEAPFALGRNATVKAYAYIPGLDIEPSDIVTYVVDSYKVNAPTGSFDVKTRLLTLSCDTVAAEIHYTFDKDGEWTPYSEPIRLRRNCSVYAKATLDGYNDSDMAEITVSQLPDAVEAPEISCTDGVVTISCATVDAEIRYTLDGTDPTMESTLYEAGFPITRNTRVSAFAYVPDLDIAPSDVASVLFDIFTVADLSYSFNAETRELTIGCGTEGATIYYTFDPNGEWTEYTAPIRITKNCILYAKGVLDGYNDSRTEAITINTLADSVPVPEISFKDGIVEISCANGEAEIRYTLDGTDPTAESTLYEAPFTLGRNATVKAYAYIPGLDIEPSDVVTYTVDSYKVETPYGEFDASTRVLTIKCDTEGSSIFYSLQPEGEWLEYTAPIAVESNGTVYAKATLEGFNDSDIAEITVSDMKCEGVTFSYNGRYLQIATAEPEARILFTTDGTNPSDGLEYSGAFDAGGVCTVRAVAVKDGYLNSGTGEYSIDFYADEEHAETAAGGLLAKAFDWDDSDLANSLENFRVEGHLDDTDYAFLRSMKRLRHLDISGVREAKIPDNAFSNSKLISISLPKDLAEYGDGILSDSKTLGSVIWNAPTLSPDERLTKGLENPNMLLYVQQGLDVRNSGAINVVSGDRTSSVRLQYGFPYYAARDFRADSVALTHDFTQTTVPDVCRGWETIVLPFTPTEITHAVNGPIVPFAAWEGLESQEKPFWLYSASSDGWQSAEKLEALVPYIISMPQNPDYVESYNLGGRVTFSATDVEFGPDGSFAQSDSWISGTRFEGTFMPVETPGVLSLNVNAPASSGLQPGSTFVADSETPPFGAYVTGASGRRAMPLFGYSNGLELPTLGDPGLTIDSPAPGVMRISSGRARKVAVTTVTGVTLRMISLRAGETVTLEDLTRDLYIVGGRKVFVR